MDENSIFNKTTSLVWGCCKCFPTSVSCTKARYSIEIKMIQCPVHCSLLFYFRPSFSRNETVTADWQLRTYIHFLYLALFKAISILKFSMKPFKKLPNFCHICQHVIVLLLLVLFSLYFVIWTSGYGNFNAVHGLKDHIKINHFMIQFGNLNSNDNFIP